MLHCKIIPHYLLNDLKCIFLFHLKNMCCGETGMNQFPYHIAPKEKGKTGDVSVLATVQVQTDSGSWAGISTMQAVIEFSVMVCFLCLSLSLFFPLPLSFVFLLPPPSFPFSPPLPLFSFFFCPCSQLFSAYPITFYSSIFRALTCVGLCSSSSKK